MKIRYFGTALLISFSTASTALAQDDTQTSFEIAGHYKSATTLSDQGQTVIAEDILAISNTVTKNKELARQDGLSLSLQGEASALFGQAKNVIVDGVDLNQNANYRALEGFGNLQLAQETGDWTTYAKAGVGVLYEDLATSGNFEDQQKFRDLSPAARFRVGARKQVNEGLSLGLSVGTTEKLD